MRKFEERNFAAPELCVTAKITHVTRDAEYSECLLREDLPKDKIGVYVIVPIERLAVDAILDIEGIEASRPEYRENYIETADCTLRLSNDEIKERFDSPNASEKDKKIAKIIYDYQNALKERELDFPEPFSDLASKKANNKKYANEFEKTLDELLANQPIVDLTTKDKEILPEPVIESDNKTKSDKIPEKFQDIKSGKFPEFPKFTPETPLKTDVDYEKKSEIIKETTYEPNSETTKKPAQKENDGFNIDFSLALTADELFSDDEADIIIPVEEDNNTVIMPERKSSGPIPETAKEPEPIKEEIVASEKATSSDVDDDEDIYKELFGENSNF